VSNEKAARGRLFRGWIPGSSALLAELAQGRNLGSHDGQLGLGTRQIDFALGVLQRFLGFELGLLGLPGRATKRASPEKMDSSALTTSTWMVFIFAPQKRGSGT
jgi:hypothetical protein